MTKPFFSFAAIVFAAVIAGLGLWVLTTHAAQAPQGGQAVQPAQPAQGAAQGQGRGQRGPATPPAPCGPNIAGDLGKKTAKDFRCFELRMYTVDPSRDGVGRFKGGIDDLHKRFREGEVEVFKKSGVEVLAVWQNLDDPNTLIYLLAYKDRAARDAGWAAFGADPKWKELQSKYFVPLTTKVIMMSAADYSPLK
ncbi:MAG: hypothetical protein DMG14_04500 [Acidobacteria bacterium]|nr:MAG: hypothetical protein DMG14_04500 [Acidobacteriota bacterium]